MANGSTLDRRVSQNAYNGGTRILLRELARVLKQQRETMLESYRPLNERRKLDENAPRSRAPKA